MKNMNAWKSLIVGILAVAVASTTTGGALPHSVSIPQEVNGTTTIMTPHKTVTTLTGANLGGKTLITDSLYPFKATGVISGSSARPIFLQRYNVKNRTWNDVSYGTAYPAKAFNLSLPQTKATETYRTYAPATQSHESHIGTATVVVRTNPKGKFYSQIVKKTRIVPWEANTAHVYVMSRLVTGETAPNVVLQESVRGHWVNVKAIKSQGNLDFTLPKGTTNSGNATKTYRYVVNATKFADMAISKAFSVRWENPHKYVGTRLTAYNYAGRYCPNMLIDIKNLPAGIAGLAYISKGVTALSPTILARDLRTVALHECAHHRQWELNRSNWSGFMAKADRLYNVTNGKGMEYNADCIANVWHRNTYWGYGRVCTGQQLVAARIMASGKRY